MKKLLLSAAALFLFTASLSAQPFSACSVKRAQSTHQLSFSVRAEANVRYYLVEGSRDSLIYDIVTRVDAKGNTCLPRTYTANSHDTFYTYYRIRQVDLTAGAIFSSCIRIADEGTSNPPAPEYTPVNACVSAITQNR